MLTKLTELSGVHDEAESDKLPRAIERLSEDIEIRVL